MSTDTVELYLDSNNIEEIPFELTHRHFIHLRRIDLSYNKLRFIPGNVFSKLTQLETLILSYNKIQCLDLNSFQGLQNLRILYVKISLERKRFVFQKKKKKQFQITSWE